MFERKPLIDSNDLQVNHLISIENDKLTLEEIILNTKNIKVISILGEARKGKSTLLNTIISSYTKSNVKLFKTSKSLDHCTQGIDYLHIPELNIVFCDVQGLKVGNSANDPKLLLITYLMSDIIIFTQQQMLNKSVLETFSPLSSFLTYIDFEQLDRRNKKPELIFRISDFTLDGTPQENLDNLFVEHEDQSKNIIINMKRLFGKISAYHTNQLDRSESKLLDNLNFYGLLENDENGFNAFIENLNIHINKIQPNHLFSKWYMDLHEFIKLINDNKKIDFNKLDVYKLLTKDELNEYQKSLWKKYPEIFNDFIVNHTQTDYDTKIKSRIDIKDSISKEFNIKFAMVNDNLKKDMYDEIINDIDVKINVAIKSNQDQGYTLLINFVGQQPALDIVNNKLKINSTYIPAEITKRFELIEQFIINNDINDYTIKIYKEWKNQYIKGYTDYRIIVNNKQAEEINNYLNRVHDFTSTLSKRIRDSIIFNKDNLDFLQKSFGAVKNMLITEFTNELTNIDAITYSMSLKTIYKPNDFPILKIESHENHIDFTYDPIKDIYQNGITYISNIDMKDTILTNYILKKIQILRNKKLYDAYGYTMDPQLTSNIANTNKDICKFYNDGNRYVPVYQYKKRYLLKQVCEALVKNKLVFVHDTHLYAKIHGKNYMMNTYRDLCDKLIMNGRLTGPYSNTFSTDCKLLKVFQTTIKEVQLKRDNYTAYDMIIQDKINKKKINHLKYLEKIKEKDIIMSQPIEASTYGYTRNIIMTEPIEANVNVIKKYKKKSIPSSLKKVIWDEYIGADKGIAKCMCCKHQDIRQMEFHCGHIIAEKDGGEINIKNLRPICAKCNLSMGATNMIEFMKKYGFGLLNK